MILKTETDWVDLQGFATVPGCPMSMSNNNLNTRYKLCCCCCCCCCRYQLCWLSAICEVERYVIETINRAITWLETLKTPCWCQNIWPCVLENVRKLTMSQGIRLRKICFFGNFRIWSKTYPGCVRRQGLSIDISTPRPFVCNPFCLWIFHSCQYCRMPYENQWWKRKLTFIQN